MPIQFTSLKQEHHAVRTGVGVFDISHMGKFILNGSDILPALDSLVPTALSQLPCGKAQYTVLLNEQGGIIDDIIVYHQSESQVSLIVNAATLDKDRDWLAQHLPNSVALTDLSAEKVLLALQGPQASEVLQSMVTTDLKSVSAFSHCQTMLLGETAFIARTGYTGEDGFEVMVSPTVGQQLWQRWLEMDVTPCGLGARDTLRLEAAMGLYGQDMDDTITPLEAGLGWLVHLDCKSDFIGRTVLAEQKAQGVEKKLVGLQMQGRQIARHDYSILLEGQPVGVVTSGTLSPTLGTAIALGYVPTQQSKVGQVLAVEVRGKACPVEVVKKPFYRSSHKPAKG